MKKNEVKVGSVYRAKVSDKLTDVRIDAVNSAGGWDATNLATGKRVRIKSAQRLRARSMTAKGANAIAAADQENARVRDERAASPDGATASERAMAKATGAKKATRATTSAAVAKGKPKAAPKAKAPKAATRANVRGRGGTATKPKKRAGILDAAAQILAKAPEPMGCKELVGQALAKKLWMTTGKTPAATLYAAIIREIAKKGDESRFEKVERGRFRLRAAKKGA